MDIFFLRFRFVYVYVHSDFHFSDGFCDRSSEVYDFLKVMF